MSLAELMRRSALRATLARNQDVAAEQRARAAAERAAHARALELRLAGARAQTDWIAATEHLERTRQAYNPVVVAVNKPERFVDMTKQLPGGPPESTSSVPYQRRSGTTTL